MKTRTPRDVASASLLDHLYAKLSYLPKVEQDNRIDECMKYLILASIKGKNGFYIPVDMDIDEVWHECILQTREYDALCKSLPGKSFIHHASANGGYGSYIESVGNEEAITEQLWWLENYCRYFGGFTEIGAGHWSIVKFLRDELGLSLEEINRIGHGEQIQGAVAA